MGLRDLFKSSKERAKEKRRLQRAKERAAKRGIKSLSRDAATLQKERDEIWARAREFVATGRKAEAAKLLQQYKVLGVQINRLEKQRMFAQNKLNTVTTAGTLGEITGAIADYAEGLGVDPDGIGENIDAINDVEGDIDAVNDVLDGACEEDAEKTAEAAKGQDDVAIDDDLMAALESEAAGAVANGSTVGVSTANLDDALNRLNALYDGK